MWDNGSHFSISLSRSSTAVNDIILIYSHISRAQQRDSPPALFIHTQQTRFPSYHKQSFTLALGLVEWKLALTVSFSVDNINSTCHRCEMFVSLPWMCFVHFQPCVRLRGEMKISVDNQAERQSVKMRKAWNYHWEILEKFNLNNTELKWKGREENAWKLANFPPQIFYQYWRYCQQFARSINSAFLDMSLEFICCIQVNCILTLGVEKLLKKSKFTSNEFSSFLRAIDSLLKKCHT